MTSSYDPQYNVFRNDVTGAVTTMRMPVKEQRKDLREVPLQIQEVTSKYWVGKNLDNPDNVFLIFKDGTYQVFNDNRLPNLAGGKNLNRLSYSDRRIDEDYENFLSAYNKKDIVAFYRLALQFRAKMETDKAYAQNPKRQKIRDLMDLIVTNNQENLKKGSKGMPGACVIS